MFINCLHINSKKQVTEYKKKSIIEKVTCRQYTIRSELIFVPDGRYVIRDRLVKIEKMKKKD